MASPPEESDDNDNEDFLDELTRESTERLSTFPDLMNEAQRRRVVQASLMRAASSV